MPELFLHVWIFLLTNVVLKVPWYCYVSLFSFWFVFIFCLIDFLCLVVFCMKADGAMNETAIPAVTQALQVDQRYFRM